MNEENVSGDALERELESAWGDEGEGAPVQDQAPVQEAPQAGQAPAQGAGQEAGQTAEQPAAQEADQAPAPELFTLNGGGETRQVSRDEVIALAQKGWDYDAVAQERDQLRQYREEAGPALELVKGYAQRNGMSVGDYLDFCRKQELMRGGMTEQDAAVKLGLERERSELDARQAQLQAEEQRRTSAEQQARQAAQARRESMERFLQVYPDVQAESIPREVWLEVAQGRDLTEAYTRYENQQLKAQLAAERQDKANRAKTPGSLGGNSGAEMDEIDRMWSEED